MTRFHNNVSKWSHINPKAAVFLPYVDCSHLTFCSTRHQEPNLKIKAEGKTHCYHSNTHALHESEQWFKRLDLSDVEVLYVYGVGLGYDYLAAKAWLKQVRKRRLVFLEDDLAVIHRLFETDIGSKIVRDPQVQLHYFKDLEERDSPLNELYWQFMTTKMQVTALRYYAKTKKQLFTELHQKLLYDTAKRDATIQEYLNYGLAFFRNFYLNMMHLAGASLGDALAGTFRGVPAIICGAGPSLTKQLDKLKAVGDRALIFAGGSALNALNAVNFQPHFGIGVDPNTMQYERLRSNSAFEVPFFYRNRMFHPAFLLIHGPHLYVSGSGGYDISDWFEEKFDIPRGNIDEGHNVVNFCVDIARVMGCNPIIFVGMDLAYTDMQAYAEGVVQAADVSKKEILETGELDSTAILRTDINGNPVYTLWKWIAESDWIGEFAKNYPDTTLVNATEGGLGFPEVPNVTFAEAINSYLSRRYDLSDRVHGEIQNHVMSQVTLERIQDAMQELCDSLERCKGYLEALIEETTSMMQQIKRDKQVPQTAQTGRAVLVESELAEEVGYRYVLDMFNAVCSKVLSSDLQNMQRSAPWKQAEKKLSVVLKKLHFLHNLSVVNIALIHQALEQNI